jgi:UrcA family protein
MKTLVAATAALLLLTGASSAFAAPAGTETASVYVSKAKLDLNNPGDAQRMMRRIDAAALQVCGADYHSIAYIKRAVASSACHRNAVAGAVAQLNSPQASLTVTGVRQR